MGMRVAVAGATGLVGQTMLQVLDERSFEVADLRLLASSRSAGTELTFRDRSYRVEELTDDSFDGTDVALFSCGGSTSRRFAHAAVEAGATVIDNSSAWRMEPGVPLVVPEVNADAVEAEPGIIANPNCSTIQLVVLLAPLARTFGLERVIVSTYQAISGAGAKAVEQLRREVAGAPVDGSPFRRPVAYNTIFHDFPDGDHETEEEQKIVRESRKILQIDDLAISATCVRIPTISAHGESVNIEFAREVSAEEIRATLAEAPGLVVIDDPASDRYPTVLDAEGDDRVFVGRIRPDGTGRNAWNFWVVADNLRKGAATNAVQIAEIVAQQRIASTV